MLLPDAHSLFKHAIQLWLNLPKSSPKSPTLYTMSQ